jgi:hypothetical protein
MDSQAPSLKPSEALKLSYKKQTTSPACKHIQMQCWITAKPVPEKRIQANKQESAAGTRQLSEPHVEAPQLPAAKACWGTP